MSSMSIKHLFYYPVKSCAGIEVAEAEVVASGLLHDRRWMVVDEAGMFVTQRERPALALVRPRVEKGMLFLSAPLAADCAVPIDDRGQQIEVEIFGERYLARTVSREADEWFSEYFHAPHRLVAFDDDVVRQGGVQYPSRDPAPTLFPDNYGLLVVSEASLSDLNKRLPEGVPFNRFRPNVVVGGLQAYQEDYLSKINADECELRFVDLCFRCNLTTIDQNTAEFGDEPLRTLMSYRMESKTSGVKFGAYFSVVGGKAGRLRVGSPMDVTWSF